MPWVIKKDGPSDKPFCVYNQQTGRKVACHTSKKKALAQMRALYANVPDSRPKMSAVFAGEGTEGEDGFVTFPNCKLFEAGQYPENGLPVASEEDLQWLAEWSDEVEIGVEHDTTVFDGLLGSVKNYRVVGGELFGDVILPKPAVNLIPPEKRKLSVDIDPESFTLNRVDLVVEPRIKDAIVMSTNAFFAKRHNTNEGQRLIQTVHDMVSRGGATCKAPGKMSDNSQFHSKHESDGIQQIHDVSVAHGAVCSDVGAQPTTGGAYYLPFSQQEARASEGEIMSEPTEEQKRSLFSQLAAFFGIGGESPAASPNQTPPAPIPQGSNRTATAEESALFSEVAALKVQMAQERRLRLQAEGMTFAANLQSKGKIAPVEGPLVVVEYVQAAEDDVERPVKITFGVSKEGSPVEGTRLDALKARYEARPSNPSFSAGESLRVMDATPGTAIFGLPNNTQSQKEQLETKAYEETKKWAESMNGKKGAK